MIDNLEQAIAYCREYARSIVQEATYREPTSMNIVTSYARMKANKSNGTYIATFINFVKAHQISNSCSNPYKGGFDKWYDEFNRRTGYRWEFADGWKPTS